MSEDPSPKKKRPLIVLAVSIVFAAGALSTLLPVSYTHLTLPTSDLV